MTAWRASIEAIEERRGSRVLVLAASALDLEILPALYETLAGLGRTGRLDVLLQARGGAANAARRIALLLNDFTDHLSFLVPHYCESAATLTVLAGREIVAGPLAIFSPIDPQLDAGPGEGGVSAASAEDLRLLAEMAQRWFGFDSAEAGRRAFDALCDSIFPTTLTSFYRATLEMRRLCLDLLSLTLPDDPDRREEIADYLLFGHHSHGYALTGGELAAIGLPVRAGGDLDGSCWEISRLLRDTIGGASRRPDREDWTDALIATREVSLGRRRWPGPQVPRWEPWQAAP